MAKSKFDSSKVIEMQDQGCTLEEILQAMGYKRVSNLKGQMTNTRRKRSTLKNKAKYIKKRQLDLKKKVV